MAVEHVDPEQVELADGSPRRSRRRWRTGSGVGAAIRTGEPTSRRRSTSPRSRPRSAIGPSTSISCCSLELTSTCRPARRPRATLGALTFVSAETGRRYGATDLQFAQELAARAAIAVDNAQLYRAAEQRRDRLAFLAEASALLGSSLDVEPTLERLANLLAERFADWVAIHLVRRTGRRGS